MSGHEHPPVPFDLIESDRDLAGLVTRLQSARLSRVAVDVEGENNLHSYGIHVALIQLFDGKRAYLVDPLAIRDRQLLRNLLERSAWVKVWFDAASDLLGFRHALDLSPAPILDLAIAAKLLGLRGGLHALTRQEGPASRKDRFQKANWLRRPFPRSLLEYAVSDVTHLLELSDRLVAQCAEQGLLYELLSRCWEEQTAERVWNPYANSVRIPGYNRMSREERRRADVLWRAREYYARKLDVPPEMAVPKAALARLVALGTLDPARIGQELAAADGSQSAAAGSRVSRDDFADFVRQAALDTGYRET